MGQRHYERRFDDLMLPHLDAAYNVARWLVKNPDDAADIVQESYVRALQFFNSYRGDNARAWLLAIVRNTGLNWLAKLKSQKTTPISSFTDGERAEIDPIDENADIELELLQKEAAAVLDQLIASLPVGYREIIILREIEELSYKEIATVMKIPVGTVMSRIARARKALRKHWDSRPENRRAP
jgi:RNA polymerase sigma-70 factor (ECF subfamily)